ncbi:GTP-binding protein [Candidatus Woesearchaeota archaeon]|nr:GTP-binding protein [Candidatus Woesearchaeota archaeon]
MDYEAEIKRLEDELRETQYNKATEHHFGVVKARIAELRRRSEKRGSTGKSSHGFDVKKTGDGTVVLLGFPSVGKSTLLNKLVGGNSKVAAYAFTTLTVIPGVLIHKGARIQILDVPGIVEGAASGRGRGKEVLAVLRTCDAIIILVDAQHPEHLPALMREVFASNVRVNQNVPDVKITRKERGGIIVHGTVKISLSLDTIKAVLQQSRINNADVVIREDVSIDQLLDVIESNRSYLPALVVLGKADLVSKQQIYELKRRVHPDVVVSAHTGLGIDELKERLYSLLGFIRVFLKEVNKKPDLDEPMIVRSGTTIGVVCDRIHRELSRKFRYARIWGPSSKFPGQVVRDKNRQLKDSDILEIHA